MLNAAVRASNSGRNVSQRSSLVKRAASSLEGVVRNRAIRSSSCLQASSDAADVASDAGGSEVGGTASLAGIVLDGTPFGLCAPPIAALG